MSLIDFFCIVACGLEVYTFSIVYSKGPDSLKYYNIYYGCLRNEFYYFFL